MSVIDVRVIALAALHRLKVVSFDVDRADRWQPGCLTMIAIPNTSISSYGYLRASGGFDAWSVWCWLDLDNWRRAAICSMRPSRYLPSVEVQYWSEPV